MIATSQTSLTARTRAILNRAVEKEWLDTADIRLVELLCAKVGDVSADSNALALVIATLSRACKEGSLCLPWNETELGGALRDFLSGTGTPGIDAASADAQIETDARTTLPDDSLAARFFADAEAGRLSAVLGTPDAPRPLLRTTASKRVGKPGSAGGNLYFHRHWFAEKTVAEALRARMNHATAAPVDDATLTAALPLALAPRQKQALDVALRERVFVLSGGPGTGKTTWIASWLRALLQLPGTDPGRIRLCAPTGRAAQRLQDSLRSALENGAEDFPVTTLHVLLGYQPRTGRFARGPQDPLAADWVLVDEASMVDVFLLAALVKALPANARLLLVGDADQLPPVDAGSVLGELLPDDGARGVSGSGEIPSVTLDESHRARGAIVPLAAAVRTGDADAVIVALGSPTDAITAFNPDTPVARIGKPRGAGESSETVSPRALKETLHAWADAAYAERRLFHKNCGEWLNAFRTVAREDEARVVDTLWEFLSAVRVLAPLKHGLFSTERANRILREKLESQWSQRGDTPGSGFHGAPILITRNDRSTGLANGELGIWLEAAGGAAVFFPRPDLPGGWLRLPVSQLPAHEPGFAVTVHKSQGSEYDEVLLILPEAGNRLLARETLYTAITRARRAVRVLGTEAAIREAVDRKLRRPGGLREMLRD
jgi:exodeoxyribonuclease V alpha subunit